MGYVITLESFRPGPRYDATPWIQARIEESTTSSGPFAPIDTQVLAPVDEDPETPQLRNFTTAEASISEGWFRVVFLDADANEQPSAPVYFPGVEGHLPTLAELIDYSNVTKPEKQPLLQSALNAALDHVRGIPRQIDLLPALVSEDPVTLTSRINGRRLIRVPDAREVTEVKIDGVAITGYELHTCRASTAVWVEIPSSVWVDVAEPREVAEVTGRFGMDPIPDDLRQAILALALRRYRERELGDGTSGASDEYGVRPLPPFPKHTFEAYAADAVFVA